MFELKQYTKLKEKQTYFPNEAIIDDDYVIAAEFSNLCRQKGIQGSPIDFLKCAVAHRLYMSIFTCDIVGESVFLTIYLHLSIKQVSLNFLLHQKN